MLLHLLQNIDRNKFDVAVVVRESRLNTSIEAKIEELGIKCLYLGMRDNVKGNHFQILQKIRHFREFSKEMKTLHPNIIHAHLECFYAPLYAAIHKKRFIFTIHSFPDRIFTKKFKKLIRLLNRQGVATLVGCAECVTERAKELLPNCGDELLATIYNPVTKCHVDVSPNNRRGSFQFVHVARMVPIKNQKLLLSAFAELCKGGENYCRLVLIGDGPLRGELEEQARQLSIRENVVFLGERRDVQSILKDSDCLVLTSDSECCPMCVLEAMASGLPIVSTDVGGVGEIVDDCGLLVPAANKNMLVSAMRFMLENPDKAEAMGKRALNRCALFDAKEVTDKYQLLYLK